MFKRGNPGCPCCDQSPCDCWDGGAMVDQGPQILTTAGVVAAPGTTCDCTFFNRSVQLNPFTDYFDPPGSLGFTNCADQGGLGCIGGTWFPGCYREVHFFYSCVEIGVTLNCCQAWESGASRYLDLESRSMRYLTTYDGELRVLCNSWAFFQVNIFWRRDEWTTSCFPVSFTSGVSYATRPSNFGACDMSSSTLTITQPP